jgi:hypothetical protein
VKIQNLPLIIAGAGGGGATCCVDPGGNGVIDSGNGSGGGCGNGSGGGGFYSSGCNSSLGLGGGAGFGASGSNGSVIGGGGFGGGAGAFIGGGGGGGGFSGGNAGCCGNSSGQGGGSYNLGTNQNNTSGANNAGGQVIIECLGPAMLTATATPTQPTCATPTQGSASIDLTGDLNGYTSGGLEYAVVPGGAFSGSPTFADVLADPFSITSGTGTVTDLDGETYTVRIRAKYNPTVVVDVNYTLQHGDPIAPSITCPANTTVPAGANCTASLPSYTAVATANDNCTPNPGKAQSPVSGTVITGSQVVTLTATDAANNSASCTFTVTVVDQTAPSVTCPNDIPCVEAISIGRGCFLLHSNSYRQL